MDMSAQKILILVTIAVVAFSTQALAKPTHIRSIDLREVINKTVCPVRVGVDEDPNRVPRRIKTMHCAQEPDWCETQRIPRHECCQHVRATHRSECVEMRDSVLVYYNSTGLTATIEVPVGCNCMIEQTTQAPDLPSGPT